MKKLFEAHKADENQNTSDVKNDELKIEDIEEVAGGAQRPTRPGSGRR